MCACASVTTMRPNTLNVCRDKTDNDTNKFIREALHAWRAKARCSVVPAERLRDLFEELHFSPTEKQINEMLQTAKLLARRGSSLEPSVAAAGSRARCNGLTFGEFCVLAADLKRFRNTTASHNQHLHSYEHAPDAADVQSSSSSRQPANTSVTTQQRLRPETVSEAEECEGSGGNGGTSFYHAGENGTVTTKAPQVFLGGSCNPTTWRADVAIPELNKQGISFYNPQVSDWTPDLIELEHRAKEKARVLFFVMDSETRASAGAIEAAHIAGQNARHLVLVLHPYKPKQCILGEPISAQEFCDLKRNQLLLRVLVQRRGLPVLDNIPSGLQRARAILDGTSERPQPIDISSRLRTVNHAFADADRLAQTGRISIAACQDKLPGLGFAENLLSTDNLCHILRTHRDACAALETDGKPAPKTVTSTLELVSFDEFCMLCSYLTVLQQELHESGCVSPIKGTNLPPPPVYLTNQLEFTQAAVGVVGGLRNRPDIGAIFRTSSCRSVPEDQRCYSQRCDSGTSSPQPAPAPLAFAPNPLLRQQLSSAAVSDAGASTDSDSNDNDSVFSGGSSSSSGASDSLVQLRAKPTAAIEMRDVYLGGSCALRSSWRTEVAEPMLRQRGVTFQQARGQAVAESLDMAIERRMSDLVLDGGCGEATSEIFEPAVMDAARVLLFVISNETRSLAPMTLAAHYIGLGYTVVLCVQMLPEFCYIGSEKLTPAAIKDYNRGRSYLSDLAKRQGVPVFADLRQALECTVEMVRAYNSRNSI